jgi:hypothetical protein
MDMFKGVEEALRNVAGKREPSPAAPSPVLDNASPQIPPPDGNVPNAEQDALPPPISLEAALSDIGEVLPEDEKADEVEEFVAPTRDRADQSVAAAEQPADTAPKKLLARPRSFVELENLTKTKAAQRSFEEKTKLDMLQGKIILRRLSLFEAFDVNFLVYRTQLKQFRY